MKTEVSTKLETITPIMAEKYLASNAGHQRNVAFSHLFHLRQQMENDQWMMTGEPIIFDVNGCLVDGQHRLRALILAGITLQFMVVRGVPFESFVAMNSGKSRSNGNIFAIHGVPNYNSAAAAVRVVLNYRRARAITRRDGKDVESGSLNSYVKASVSELIEEYDKHPCEYGQAIAIALACKKSAPVSAVAAVAAIALIDARHGIDEVLLFWDGFRTGANLESDDPILYLNNKMRDNAGSRNKMSQNMVITLMIEAWNRYVKGTSCKFIRIVGGSGCPEVL